MDIWINNSPENAVRVKQALEDFGFSFPNLTASDLQEDDMILQLGYPPYRIDIITSPSGVQFDECYPKRKVIELNDQVILNVIDIESLKKNKLASGRNKDLDDLEKLS